MNEPMTVEPIAGMREPRIRLMYRALCTLARTGHSVGLELWRDMELEWAYYPEERAVKRAMMFDLPGQGYAIKETPKLHLNMRLTLLRLSEAGREYCQMAGWEIKNSDWQVMIDGHNGEEDQRHTMGVLALAWQARKRGHDVRLLPGRRRGYTMGTHWVEPDLEIAFLERGRVISFVPFEFETKPRGKEDKWQKWNRVLGGWGICTFGESQRETTWRELKRCGVTHEPWMISLEALMRNTASKIFEWRPR